MVTNKYDMNYHKLRMDNNLLSSDSIESTISQDEHTAKKRIIQKWTFKPQQQTTNNPRNKTQTI